MRCFQCEIDSIDNLIESIDIIYKYSYNGEKERNAAHGIRQLEAYVYTVKYRSFSLAAQKLYLSQPTVSAHICNLEKELHTQLLKRTTKNALGDTGRSDAV